MYLPEIRLQIAAVTLADERNFTRAAERLRITQPALSKRIAELEELLGFEVFSREQKQVDLTEAGQVFMRGCKDALAILEKAVRTGKAAQEQLQPVVTIGHGPYTEPLLVSALLHVHLPFYPTLRLHLETMFAKDLVHGVLSAQLDMALIDEPLDNPLLTQVPLTTAPLNALIATEHPAAFRSSVSIDQFGNIGWMMFPQKANPHLYERVMEALRQAAVAPVELHHYMGPQEVLHLIAENFGVAAMPQGMAAQLVNSQTVARPFAHEGLKVTSYLILRADQSSRLINEFGRAYLRRVAPTGVRPEGPGQLSLKL